MSRFQSARPSDGRSPERWGIFPFRTVRVTAIQTIAVGQSKINVVLPSDAACAAASIHRSARQRVRVPHVAIDGCQSGEHEIPKRKNEYGWYDAELFKQDAGNRCTQGNEAERQ